jgi:hypothetical protein
MFVLSSNETSEEEREIREALPFWARELLTMKDEAERKHRVHGPYAKEGS